MSEDKTGRMFYPTAFNNPNDMEHFLEKMPLADGKSIAHDIGIGTGKRLRRGESLSMHDTITVQKSMLIEYNDKLIEHGYGMSKNEIKSKDTINLIAVCNYKKNSMTGNKIGIPIVSTKDIDFEFYERVGWLSFVPCFQEGVLKLNIGRFVYWNIKSIDVPERTITIFLQDYTFDNGLWSVGVSGTVKAIIDNDDITRDINVEMYDETSYSLLYKAIPYSKLRWDKQKINVWETITIEYAKNAEKSLKSHDTNGFTELVKLFQHFIIVSNQILDKNKPKAKRETREIKQKRISIASDNVLSSDRKIVRTVGPITISSAKPPKQATEELIVHYKTATWKCRGGIRRLKTGKVVPFKSSVKHRRCLQKSDYSPQMEIRFKK